MRSLARSARSGRPGAALVMAAALALGACAGQSGTASTTPEAVASLSSDQIRAAAEGWQRIYAQNPNDRSAVLNYSAALRLNGQDAQAVAVLRQAVIQAPDDVEISAAYGKALAATGQLEQALTVIRAAQRPELPDWRLLSAEGAILDQMGQHEIARQRYDQALGLAPGEPSVLNNEAMSYLLTGDAASAERLLRQALANPRATGQVRQNLALAVGLQGRFDEAMSIAAQVLDRAQAEANVAYLRSMLSQSNTWQQIQNAG